jgi:LemA protein
MRRRFPGNLMAGLVGFEERPYFEVAAEAKTAPKVDFGKK